jgi:hypothetical protein
MSNINNNIPEFGLDDPDYNWSLLNYLDSDTLSKLPLCDFQIDALADRLNWDIMSEKKLSGWIFVKHKHRINWRAFIINSHPKELIYLDQVRDKLTENADLFLTPHDKYTKYMYYTPMFMSMFPNLIDWKWCSKNIQIGDFLLNKFWNRMQPTTISKYQIMSEELMKEKASQIKWVYACRNPLSESFIKSMHHRVDWYSIAKYQKLSMSFIESFMHVLDSYAISRYQDLTSEFLIKHRRWLKMPAVSQFQDMSIEYLQENIQYLTNESLLENRNYNRQNTIQIIMNHSRIYIIDTPTININKQSEIIFCQIDSVTDSVLNARYINGV